MRAVNEALEWLPILNLCILIGVIAALSTLAYHFYRRRQFFVDHFRSLADEIKKDLPPVIVGEILMKWDLVNYERRLTEVEAKADWLEQQQNGGSTHGPSASA